jgi:hypothetical protein
VFEVTTVRSFLLKDWQLHSSSHKKVLQTGVEHQHSFQQLLEFEKNVNIIPGFTGTDDSVLIISTFVPFLSLFFLLRTKKVIKPANTSTTTQPTDAPTATPTSLLFD